MAETIRRRIQRQDEFIDDRLEPAMDCARRAFFRGQLRAAYGDPALLPGLARQLALPELAVLCGSVPFEAAWDAIESTTWLRTRRKVSVAGLSGQTAQAIAILTAIRAGSFNPGEQSELEPAGRD